MSQALQNKSNEPRAGERQGQEIELLLASIYLKIMLSLITE
jgi:hypothetical protein